MGCHGFDRICIIYINILFAIPTVGMVVIAIMLNYLRKTEILDFYQGHIVEDLNEAINATGLGGENFYSDGDLITWMSSFLLILMICGAILLVIITVGLLGSWCRMDAMLTLYIILLILCIIIELCMLVFTFFSGTMLLMAESIQRTVKPTIAKYEGLAGNNIETFGWNFVMQRYDCCGLYGEEDFTQMAGLWNTTIVVDSTTYELARPIACCVNLPYWRDNSVACATSTAQSNEYFTTGCYSAVEDASIQNMYIGFVPLIAGFICQIILLTCAIYRKYEKIKREKMAARTDDSSSKQSTNNKEKMTTRINKTVPKKTIRENEF